MMAVWFSGGVDTPLWLGVAYRGAMSVRSVPGLFVVAGACAFVGSRSLLQRVLLFKVRRDVRALNAGDYRPLLASYSQNAVLRFPEGDHRWSGEHRGRESIERFLQEFVAAGLQGEVCEVIVGGPPWRMTVAARFNDRASGPGGEELYRNRALLLLRVRWGQIVHQEDFFEDTERIALLEARLREPVPR